MCGYFSVKTSIQFFLQACFYFLLFFNASLPSPFSHLKKKKVICINLLNVFYLSLGNSYLHRPTILLSNHVPPVLQRTLQAFESSLPEPHTTSHVHTNQAYFAQWCQEGISIRDLREPRCIRRERTWAEKQEWL